MADKKDKQKIGYGNPPRHTQFKKGQSGNRRGRPKGSRNIASLLAETLAEQVVVTEDGQRRKISKLQAAIKQLVNRAASGDQKHLHELLSLTHWVEGGGTEDLAPAATLSDAEREVIDEIYARIKRIDGERHD